MDIQLWVDVYIYGFIRHLLCLILHIYVWMPEPTCLCLHVSRRVVCLAYMCIDEYEYGTDQVRINQHIIHICFMF